LHPSVYRSDWEIERDRYFEGTFPQSVYAEAARKAGRIVLDEARLSAAAGSVRSGARPRRARRHVAVLHCSRGAVGQRERVVRHFVTGWRSGECLPAARRGESPWANAHPKIALSAPRDIPFNKLVPSQANGRGGGAHRSPQEGRGGKGGRGPARRDKSSRRLRRQAPKPEAHQQPVSAKAREKAKRSKLARAEAAE
jgi:hypothetical protein